ncbi:hypothetical protein PPYR_11642 [Photinus pyralis]|uniref:Lipase domain-containing protein n=1 Tax=Photinus pyralis TaxID=7054 RepID=A0A5N4ABU8_PHOPY|nr:hypothetical protein PPYR_11642 [Photinus pyralis]
MHKTDGGPLLLLDEELCTFGGVENIEMHISKVVLLWFALLRTAHNHLCGRTSKECPDFLREALLAIAQDPASDDGILTQYWWYNTDTEERLNSPSEVDPSKPVKILLHGAGGSKDDDCIVAIRDAYLERYGDSVTLIVLDFSVYVASANVLLYANSYANAPAVARDFGKFLCSLIECGINPGDVHVVGYSLGAQIAGVAGAYVQQHCGVSIGRITGLDPAGLGFNCLRPNKCRLDQLDADFVDIIHTNAGGYGITFNCGHHDFYVNGGFMQPNCADLNLDLTQILQADLSSILSPVSCSHQHSCFLFAESILSNSFPTSSCFPIPSDTQYMGEYCKPMPIDGTACMVATRRTPPYGFGPNGPLE